MNKKTFTGVIAILLITTLVIPAAFFIAPQRASAAGNNCLGGLIGGMLGGVGSKATSVPTADTETEAATSQTSGATLASCINELIIIPLIRAEIRAILQKMTASVINWINGGNGTGQPSYVQNLSEHLQSVGDSAALSLIAQVATSFNSPFGSTISKSLRTNYLQNTSMAGFWAANQCTLSESSPDVNKFLAGDWSQGGITAWFALTTEDQNNPYTLYQSASSQVDSNVNQAQTNRRQDLLQSQGFLSWCGGDSTRTSSSNEGISPSAPCTNPDGSTVDAQTPGSIIHDYTQEAVVASGFDQLISANDLDDALSSIITALLAQVLGGSGGLLGSSGSSASSVTNRLQDYSDSSVTTPQAALQIVQTMLTRIADYTTAWNTIIALTNNASTSVASLTDYCTAQGRLASTTLSNGTITDIGEIAALNKFINTSAAQIVDAQNAIATEIVPVIEQLQSSLVTIANTQLFALKVQSEASSTATTGSSGALTSDIPMLAMMPPSAIDVSDIQQAAEIFGGAKASPSGSLTVYGGTLADQMILLSTNANALKLSSCDMQTAINAYFAHLPRSL